MIKKKGLFLIAIIFALSTFLTGCNGGNANVGESQMPDVAYYSYYSEPINDWDPSVEASNGSIVLNNMYETLLRYDPLENKIIYVLAEDYSKSEDGLTWIFNIRKGVKFHDGTDVNAEAVKFSVERTIKLGKGLSYIWDPVDEINVLDDYTVEFKLKYPVALDMICCTAYSAFIMSPKSVSENPDDWLSKGNDAGSGPYMLESFKMGDEVVLTKFDDYWQGWEGKHFHKIVFKRNAETSTRRQMVEKGEADVTMALPAEDLEGLKQNPNVEIRIEPSFENVILFFNMEDEVLSNKLLRQALSYAFPYEDVVKYAMGGYAKQSRGAIPHGHWGNSDKLFRYNYDLEKAKELLAKAGYPNGGLKFEITYQAGDEGERKIVELYKAELAKLNIDLEIRAMPWESQWSRAKNPNPEDRQDIFLMVWWPDIPSPYSWLYSLYHTEEDILYNMSYYKSKEFDELIDKANEISGVDRQKAEEMFIKAQEILLEDAPSIFAVDKQYVWVLNKSFKGHKHNPLYQNVTFFYDTYRE